MSQPELPGVGDEAARPLLPTSSGYQTLGINARRTVRDTWLLTAVLNATGGKGVRLVSLGELENPDASLAGQAWALAAAAQELERRVSMYGMVD